jgi:hypothetical protein
MVILKCLVSFLAFIFGELREIERIVWLRCISLERYWSSEAKDHWHRSYSAHLQGGFRCAIHMYVLMYIQVLMIELISLSFLHWISIKRSEYVSSKHIVLVDCREPNEDRSTSQTLTVFHHLDGSRLLSTHIYNIIDMLALLWNVIYWSLSVPDQSRRQVSRYNIRVRISFGHPKNDPTLYQIHD